MTWRRNKYFSNERTCTRKKDVEGLSCGFEDIYFSFETSRVIQVKHQKIDRHNLLRLWEPPYFSK